MEIFQFEVALLLHFCRKMKVLKPSIFRDPILENLYRRQIDMIEKRLPKLHEDLQYDYSRELQELYVSNQIRKW